MKRRQLVRFSGVVLFKFVLVMSLAGCGGGQETGPDGEVKFAPVVNPAPGVVPLDQEYENRAPAAARK